MLIKSVAPESAENFSTISSIFAPKAGDTRNEQLRHDLSGDHRAPLPRACSARRRIPRPARFPRLRSVPLARTRPKHDRAKPGQPLGAQGWVPAELRALFRCPQIVGNYLGR